MVSRLPDRPNIFLKVIHQKNYDVDRDLAWLVTGLRQLKESFPKTLVYAETRDSVGEIYTYLRCSLGKDAFCNGDTSDPTQRTVSMFHSTIGNDLASFSVGSFKEADSKLRVIVCTIAFGMGVEVPDVLQVIHWGRSSTVMGFWQEVGRAGRQGQRCIATCYPKSTARKDKPTFDLIKDGNVCVRKTILATFVLNKGDLSELDKFDKRTTCKSRCDKCECTLCMCCTFCVQQCECSVCL